MSALMVEAYYKAQIIAQDMLASGQFSLDIVEITKLIDSTPSILAEGTTSIIYLMLASVWLLGLIDLYLIGKKLDID